MGWFTKIQQGARWERCGIACIKSKNTGQEDNSQMYAFTEATAE